MTAAAATVVARRVARSVGADCYRNDNDGVLVITRADGAQLGIVDDGAGQGEDQDEDRAGGWTAAVWHDGSWEAVDGEDRVVVDRVERCVRDWAARADVAGHALTATVTGRDAWGQQRRVTVAWLPRDATDEVNDVTGWPRVVVGADPERPPIGIGRSNLTGQTYIASRPVPLSGQSPYVHEWTHAPEEADRGPGTYWILTDTDTDNTDVEAVADGGGGGVDD